MPKILFIQPTQYGADGALCKQKRLYLPSLAFPLLAAMTPPNWKVEVCLEVIDEVNFDSDADIVGIGSMGHAALRGIEIAREFRKRGKTVVMGGYMVSLAKEIALETVNSVIVRDAEISYPMMLEDFERTGTVRPIYDNPPQNLAGLPVPRYELLLEKPIGYMLPVQAGRGCTHSCTFCAIACLYKGTYMTRPVAEVVRDIRKVKELGFRQFYLIDDNIISNRKYFVELCEAIVPLRMSWGSQCSLHIAKDTAMLELARKSGVTMMSFGIESITQDGLDRLGKRWLRVEEHDELIARISKAGILVSSEMITGTDSDTEESIGATFDFMQRTRIAIPRFYILTPTPGTKLFNEYRDQGRLLTENLSEYNGVKAVHKPEKITPEKLEKAFWLLNDRVFSLASIIWRTLLNPGMIRNPFSYIFAFFVNLHYRKYVKKRTPPNIY